MSKNMSKMSYDTEYIQEALNLSDEVGVREAAKRLGIPVSTLSHWRTGARKAARQAGEPDSNDPRDQEIKDQEARIKALTESNDNKDQLLAEKQEQIEILKATISYFGLDRKH